MIQHVGSGADIQMAIQVAQAILNGEDPDALSPEEQEQESPSPQPVQHVAVPEPEHEPEQEIPDTPESTSY